MKTPIVDFVSNYIKSDVSRLHMPGHKGKVYLGIEQLDITEIQGADVLYSAEGIINESEENASSLFRTAHTFYSTEGSSLTIKAMLSLVYKKDGYILAARNVHKSFIYACALLDIDVKWIFPDDFTHICSCNITAGNVREAFDKAEHLPIALYLTSPDYMGNILDIKAISEVCDEYGVDLLVDNAHGAYLAFCEPSQHPIALGATMCCDSAHKTLPALTGGAYLHISKKADEKYIKNARTKLSIFASTSPSYLVLQSLDMCNKILSGDYADRLKRCIKNVDLLKRELLENSVAVCSSEALKLVIDTCKMGYTGYEIAELLRKESFELEFFDRNYVVAMFSPDNDEKDYKRLTEVFLNINKKRPIIFDSSRPSRNPIRAMTIREAVFAEAETVRVSCALGRVCASPTVSCPPAVPIVMSGEVIGENEIALFGEYAINTVEVVK